MTVAMQATKRPSGPRVLRIGLVVAGRVVEERVVKQRTSVTVGASERSMFVLPGGTLSHFELFERVGTRYYLNLLDGMTGRLALAGEIVELATIRAEAEQGGREPRIALDDDARGRVTIGNYIFLFQFVTLAPTHQRPRLPLYVKGNLASRVDWNLAIIVAFSFLVHFGLVGAAYSDWMDSVVDEEITAHLIGEQAHDPHPALLESVEATASATTAEAAAPTAETRARARPGGGAPKEPSIGRLVAEANALRIGVLGVLRAGPNVDRVRAGESGAPLDLNKLPMTSGPIVDHGGLFDGLDPGGPLQPGNRQRPEDLLPRTTGTGPTGAGQATKFVPVLPEVQRLALLESGHVPNAEATIHRLIEPGARRCYQNGLRVNPTQSGKLVIVIRIGNSGEVDSVDIAQNGGLSADVALCVATVAKRARFDPPGSNGSVLSVPFNFLRQGG
jgi:hypothetical protein